MARIRESTPSLSRWKKASRGQSWSQGMRSGATGSDEVLPPDLVSVVGRYQGSPWTLESEDAALARMAPKARC
jgi:hypothetical protein